MTCSRNSIPKNSEEESSNSQKNSKLLKKDLTEYTGLFLYSLYIFNLFTLFNSQKVHHQQLTLKVQMNLSILMLIGAQKI